MKSVEFPRSVSSSLLIALFLSAACAGGGGGGDDPGSTGGSGGRPLNEGSLSLGDFDYRDEHAPGFHPLGEDGFKVLSRDELFAIYSTPRGGDRYYELWDGPDAAYRKVPEMAGLFRGGESVRGAASGQMDLDVEDELVVATLVDGGNQLNIDQVDRLPTGQYQRTPLQSIPAGAWRFSDARVSLGDLDGDHRNELIVVARPTTFQEPGSSGHVWAFQHPQDGGGELGHHGLLSEGRQRRPGHHPSLERRVGLHRPAL